MQLGSRLVDLRHRLKGPVRDGGVSVLLGVARKQDYMAYMRCYRSSTEISRTNRNRHVEL